MRDITERAFQAYFRSLESATSFKSMGRIMADLDEDWPLVLGDLEKESKSWACLSNIEKRLGKSKGVGGCFERWWCRRWSRRY